MHAAENLAFDVLHPRGPGGRFVKKGGGVEAATKDVGRAAAGAEKAAKRSARDVMKAGAPSPPSGGLAASLGKMGSREDAHAAIAHLTVPQLKDLARATGSYPTAGTKVQLRTGIVEHTVGFRLNSQTIRGSTITRPAEYMPAAGGLSATEQRIHDLPAIKAHVREAYDRLRAQKTPLRYTGGQSIPASSWIDLADIRRELGDIPRPQQDAALTELATERGVVLSPTHVGKSLLLPETRAAALRLGGEDNTMIHFDSPSQLHDRLGPSAPAATERRVYDAYQQLAREPGGYVKLADLRANLGSGHSESEVTDTLRRMAASGSIVLTPEEDRRRIRPGDHAAAVRFGDMENHFISISPHETHAAGVRSVPLSIEQRVHDAYQQLAKEPGGYVSLADLRDKLPDVPRSQLDAALIEMDRHPGVHVHPVANQGTLTPRERAGSLTMGGEEQHALSIEAGRGSAPSAPAKVAPAKRAARDVMKGAPAAAPADLAGRLGIMRTREEGHAAIAHLSVPQLRDLARQTGMLSTGPKEQLRNRIVEHTIGFRLNSETIRGSSWSSPDPWLRGVPPASAAGAVESFNGRTRASWAESARRAGIAVPEGATADQIAALVEQHRAGLAATKRSARDVMKAAGRSDVMTAAQADTARRLATVAAVRHAASAEGIERHLADSRLTASDLRQLAAELGITIPSNARTQAERRRFIARTVIESDRRHRGHI